LRLVDDIRRQRCGQDPFMPILLTAWNSGLSALRPVVDSGADDVLLHPFSTAQMGERIDALVRCRKPFVVSEDYFGPDRRSTVARLAGAPAITVPNALRARVLGESELNPTPDRIVETFLELRRYKLRNLSRRIWHMANHLKDAQLDPKLPDRYDSELNKLAKSIDIYSNTLAADEPSDMRSLCDSLAGVVKKQLGKKPVRRGLELLEQSALALRVASKLEHDQDVSKDADNAAIAREESKISNKISDVNPDLIRAVMG
jgi:CheY-like chemotaxis protein